MKEHFAQPKPLAAIVRHAAKSACIAAFAMTALLLPRTVRAQHAPVAFRNLNTSDGLCSNYVKGITQDHRGCLWVATEAGLARFDGSGFTTFSRSTSGLCSDELNDVYYHPATRRLWIASQRDGISVYDIDRQRMAAHYTADNGLMTNDVTHISGAADGGIWITHYHLGVEHFSPATGRFTRYDQTNVRGLKGLRSWVVADDGRGHLFIGHDGGGMSVVDLRTRSLRRFAYSPAAAAAGGIPGPVVHSILFDRQGRCWVGTSQGLALFSLSTGRFTTFRHNAAVPGSILSDQVMSIGQTRSGDLWVCTDMGGVSILRAGTVPAEGAFENHAMQPSGGGLSSASAFDFFEDSYGNVWIGNYRSGLDYLSHTPSLFTTLPYARLSFSSLSYKPVWGLLADGTGRLWMGGEDELVAMDGQQTAASVNLNAVGRNVHVNALHRTPDGLLWLGLYNRGMAVFSPATQHVTPVAMPDGPVTVNCFARDAHGTLWAGTERGLVVIAGGEVRPAAALNSQMADLMVRSIAFDRRGQLWVGTFGRGVYVFNAQGRAVAHVERGSGLRSNAVNQLMLARDGSMWAATRLGLAHFADVARPGSVKVFGHDQGLTEEHVHAIAEDADGNVWLSTNAHIARFVTRRLSFDNFAPRMGMPTGDFVSGSVAQGIDGSIYFGSLAGVCRFNPRDFKRLTAQADVCITGLVAYGSPGAKADSVIALPLDQPEVRVPYNRNTIRLTFNVADVAQAPLTEYAYRVAEFADGQWLSTQGENYVTFRDLAPGTYNISIRSRMAGQQWDTHTAMVRIVVAPPFWLAWYAKLLYAALAVLLVWWLMRSYKHKTDLESRLRIEHHRHMNDVSLNQERLRFYTNITHELRTPLTLIVGPLDDMASDATVPAPVQSRLAVIRRSANRLLGLVNELLEFRKTETQNRRLRVIHGDLAEEVKGIVLHFKELNRRPEVTLRTDIAEGSYVQWFDPEIIRIVLDNFLSNAMKYTPEGEVVVALAHEGARTVLRVSDTGYGIPAEALPHLFQRYYQAGGPHQVTGSGIGLALVKSVAELHHATVSAANGEQGGSVFSFTLLTADTYGHDEAEAATPEAPQPKPKADRRTTAAVVRPTTKPRPTPPPRSCPPCWWWRTTPSCATTSGSHSVRATASSRPPTAAKASSVRRATRPTWC